MAKGKGKRSSGATAVAPEGGVNDSNAGADAVPQFEESAFAGLRQKIEQRLKDQNAAKQKPKNNKKAASNDTPKKNNEATFKPDTKRTDTDKNNKGKKRDRNGEVIAREDKNASGREKSSKPKEADQSDALRQEILALGGTEEDYNMLAGVDSESEVEDAKNTSKGSGGKSVEDALRKELSGILAAAGQVVPDDIADDEEDEAGQELEEEEEEGKDDDDEEEEDMEDDEADIDAEDDNESEEEDQESSDEDVPPTPVAKEAKKEKAKPSAEPPLPKEYSKLAVPPRSDWFMTELPSISAKQANTLPKHLIDRVHNYAVSLLEEESNMYSEAQKTLASSSHKFYATIMSTGTLSDKISALTLAIQESPVHNAKSLENLIALGKKRSRAQAVEVLRTLKDMFAQGTLLPNDRRLRSFANQPSLMAAFQGAGSKWSEGNALPNGLQKRHLIVWAFEHFLKEQYFEVLKILEVWCNDEIEFSRSRAVSYVYELLKEKPEQETNLLRLLVNKLGDTAKKIASRASYLLLQLEQAHPLMKPTIIKAVEEVLFRPGQSQHAKYYAIITLNQTVLSTKEEQVAAQLLDIYFALFVAFLKPTKKNKYQSGKKHAKGAKLNRKALKALKEEEKGQAQHEEMQEKLTSGVLTGVNRAYPFTSSDSERLSKHVDTLFRITHSSNFNTSIQALMLIQQLTSSHQIAADRFYRTLYESLLDPRLATSSKQALYLNLLFKALKSDVNARRVKAFVKRIIQVLGLHQPAFICGVMYLIRELEKTFSSLNSLYDQPEDNDSDDEEVFRDVPDEDDETQEQPEAQPKKPSSRYDPRKRDPEHSNADRTCLWELLPYLSHFHPSVSVNAAQLLEHKTMSGKPDMTIHTLMHFLDRFVYKTPKASAATRGASIMQPLAGSDAQDRLVSGIKQSQEVPLNSEAFWKKKSDEVAAEDVFFHEYFNRVDKDKDKSRKKAKDPVEHAEEDRELSDAESEIWKALVDSKPEVEGADSDDDLDLDDLESAYDQDEDEEEQSGEEGVIFNDESDVDMDDFEEEASEKPATKSKAKKAEDTFDEDDDFDMDVSDDEAFLDSDEDLPSDVELGGGVELPKEDDKSDQKKKKRKLKHLPTFASADDYAALLAGEDEGM
ncbi:CBF/Mak21 family-domain-containing protein [Aspergillus pseudonomiae]|uniref:CBF/Mak21 family-domain-containing protein n=1 Tax=Aspergillus pseudonomiae TaxID=1506151 RepID=A0A5N6HTH4_9EURO|nr:CBF/Mak21 family-domain-containing protein [Aspergillus pseudonomiae]KAB8257705.1 CBF/Mak21 family-domain-containing protein [Aspergillus pseudonomiae]KAE8401250.1 CBF/Mak21 family-domain-containing protein [Aspergillus pseudonomiae]